MCLIKYFYLVQILVLAHAQNPPPPYGQLQIKGRFVEDSHGNVVQLRGMSLMASDYLSEWFNETAIYQTKCNWNSNIIRFGQMPSTSCCGGWNNTKDRDYTRMVNAVNACIKHGIYAIVDWHAFDDPQIDLAKDFFANMSKTFSGHPNVLYEIWNEPSGSNGSWANVKSYAETIIDIIRQNDPENIIIVGTPTWSQRVDQAAADPINRTNIAYTLHYYAATHKQSVRDIALDAINQNLPIFITEYGLVQASGAPPINYNESVLWWEFNDQYQLSYVNWGMFAGDDGGANALLRGAGPFQVGDPQYWSSSGKIVNKKYRSTDQGVYCSSLSRLDCHPDPGLDQNSCYGRGCVFDTNSQLFDTATKFPQCYFPSNTGYVSEVPVNSSTSITLKKSSASAPNPFGQDFNELTFQSFEIGSALRITISPKGANRYRPPVPINTSPQIQSSEKLNIIKQNTSTFSFMVQRQSTGTNIWDTSIGGLLFSDKYLQIATYLPTDKIYGFGEHYHTSIKHNLTAYHTWGMWARDIPPTPNKNLYGVHPFYLGLEDDGKAHGVFIFNSNAQEITLGPAPHLVYRTIGGQFEIYYFPGPTPEQVIQQYEQVIGTPFMPAYWALGFHICRYGYGSTKDVQTVVNRTWAANVPFDTAWADINYMDQYKDFTLNPTNWGNFGNYTNYLHDQGMHVILITDPAIEADYDSFQRAMALNASFIQWPNSKLVPPSNNQYPMVAGTKIMLAAVWPNNLAAFPDFLDPSGVTTQWWVNEFTQFRKTVALDGVWIDMNEPSVFDTAFFNETFSLRTYRGGKYIGNVTLNCPIAGADSGYDMPPYETISAFNNGPHLASKTLCLCGVSGRGSYSLYDTKNLYGWSEMVATAQVQKQAIGKRGAVISRSTFPSSGVYGGHWTGDILSSWDDLKASIIAIQEFNMFGIPFVGADICGFREATTEELCLRWQQLGAFYPFSRNHNDQGQPAQDPAVWPSVAESTRKANLFRYRHLPYLYSLLFSAALKGGTVARPVFFEFPNDNYTYDLSLQFLWGPALMIIPVTDEFQASVNGYLPFNTTWYSVYDYFYGNSMATGYTDFPAPQEYLIPVFVRGGYILPRQRPSVTTTLSRQNEFQILIALNNNNSTNTGTAMGELYWDDGDSVINDITTYNYYHFQFNFNVQATSAIFNITMDKKATNLPLKSLDNIEIFGYPYTPNLSTAKLNGNPITINTQTSSYSPFTKVLNITTTNFIDLNNNGPTWILTWNNS